MHKLPRNTLFIVYCALQCCLIACLDSHHLHDEPNGGEFALLGRNTEELVRPKCDLCAFPGSTIRNDFVPSLTRAATRITLSITDMTCMEWNNYAMKNQLLTAADSADCLDLRDWLSWQCCEGMPSLHECETTIEKTLLSNDNADYDRSKIPITDGTALDVRVTMHLTDISIVNHGVDGGAVELSGALQLEWVDDRLRWNSSDAGCSSISASDSKIWIPQIKRDIGEEDETSDTYQVSRLDILADGRIFGAGRLHMTASCEPDAAESWSRVCSTNFLDSEDMGKVRYVTDPVIYDDDISLPGYVLDRNQTAMLMDATLIPYNVEQNVRLQLYFRPQVEKCDICGSIGELYDGKIVRQGDRWKRLYPGTEDFNCFEINDLLAKLSIHSQECYIGRSNFIESCCTGTISSYECETNIHDQIVERANTITPPDPSAHENLDSFRHDTFGSKDKVDISVSLDVIQMIEINVKSNTLKMLVSLELAWFDQRLEWKPFIGGCYRVSYRASIDAELTEIWVPNIEMANMIEGVQSLPEAHASVYDNGLVIWRRTGVLTGTCELEGIKKFPFDTISCYFDFGEDRDPLFHRVNYYNSDEVQFYSSLQDKSWNYQEYRLIPNETEVKFRTENLSGFENRLIRYRFYFERASNYYVHMFLVTYLSFTYLSFGMFFIDPSGGERLGYGTSILFVIVAQDITLADSAPVTEEFLWIYQLSLGSKILVIFGIVETLVVQWVLHKQFESSKQNTPVLEEEHFEEREDTKIHSISTNAKSASKYVQNVDNGESIIDDHVNDNTVGSDSGENVDLRAKLNNLTQAPAVAIKKGAEFYLMIGNKLTSLEIYKDDSKRTKIEKKIKIVDVASAAVCFVAYSVLVLILGITAS